MKCGNLVQVGQKSGWGKLKDCLSRQAKELQKEMHFFSLFFFLSFFHTFGRVSFWVLQHVDDNLESTKFF
jgi:hypothetical protein